jgi:F-type H+-transporting ATPase subunit gamma
MHIREIRAKIDSTRSTRKITRAMEMIARTKMASAQKRARDFRPYAARVAAIAARMLRDRPDCASALMRDADEIRRIGVIVVSTDRGLCGPLNARLMLGCAERLGAWEQAGAQVELTVIGARGLGPLVRHGGNVVAHAQGFGGEPRFDDVLGAMLVPLTAFVDGRLDEVWVAYNHLTNALDYAPRFDRVLPIAGVADDADDCPAHEDGLAADYLYEPAPKPVVETVLLRHVEACFYHAVVENFACEQCARMFAMQNATRNADQMLGELRHIYQKTRQAQITTELCEIVAGAAAIG